MWKRPTFFQHCVTFLRKTIVWSKSTHIFHIFSLEKAFYNLKEKISKKNVFFCCFQLGEKWLSSLMRILPSISRHCKILKFLTILVFAYLRHLVCLKLERGADWGRSGLLILVNSGDLPSHSGSTAIA